MFWKKSFAVLTIVVVIIAACTYHYLKTPKVLSPVITTNLGKVQGLVSISRSGKEFYEFLGLRYAKPPINELRFEPPQPAEKWDEVRDATNYGNECTQLKLFTGLFGGEEDCLFLNVFTPKNRKGLLPVMVFIHGGAYVTGSSNGYKAKYFMENEDVILVTLNYRLAALGFLNTGDGVVRGNMGLKDQNMALKWVRDNIKMFGGNPKLVTLFGESAGSSSTAFHILSKQSAGLFSNAILQSGVANSKWSVFLEPAKQAKRFAKKFGCDTSDTKIMVKCLKTLDSLTIVKAHEEMTVPLREQITVFVPTLEAINDENAFLTEEPVEILKAGTFNKVNVIAGVLAQEGLLSSAIITSNQSKLEQANDEFYFWSSRLLYYPEDRRDASDKIRKFYFGDLKNIASSDLIENYTNLFSDRSFFSPLHQFATLYSKQFPLRLYYFTYQGAFSLSYILVASQRPYLPVVANVILDYAYRWFRTNIFRMESQHPGVCHADELQFFFNWPISSEPTVGSTDYEMSVNLVKLWTSFAKEEKVLKFLGVEWKTANSSQSTLSYFNIHSNPEMMEIEPFRERVNFWSSLNL